MLEQILKDCKFVSDNSESVKINYSKIEPLIEELNEFSNQQYLITNPFGIMELDDEQIINFMLLYDAIDFSFWGNPKWEIDSESGKLDGGYGLLYAMLDSFKPETNYFDKINGSSVNELKDIFKGNVEIPLIKERINILKQVSEIVKKEMNNNFYNSIKGMDKIPIYLNL
jgi:hypothetical protein